MIEDIIYYFDANTELLIAIFIIIAYIFLEISLRKKTKKLKDQISEKYKISFDLKNDVSSIENIEREDQLLYYKHKNFLSVIRFGVLFTLVTFYILHKLPNFFSFFAIAVGSIIITFKEVILCFIGFFYISTQYRIGDSITINNGTDELKGNIIYINILNVVITGRDSSGENNGKYYRIPNYKFFTEIVKREEIGLFKSKKEEIVVTYSSQLFPLTLEEFLKKLTAYLDENLPKGDINSVGDYKSFIGYKYKMRLEQEKEFIFIKIFFISRPKNTYSIERGFFSFVESLKNLGENKKEV